VNQAGNSDNWTTVRSTVRLVTSDGGILDADDCVYDVVDDREQVNIQLVPYLPDAMHMQYAYIS